MPAAVPLGLGALRDYAALTKPRVTALVAVTAVAGYALAGGDVATVSAAAFLLATWAIVGAANALNGWVERDSDALMERTRRRPLPAGRIAARPALVFGLGLGGVATAALAASTNAWTTALGAGAFVVYVWVYTPLKRRSPWALHVGAIPGALPPIMGVTAATGRPDALGLALFAILFLWQIPHFVAIASLRRDDYARAGLAALPVVLGRRAAALHAAVAAALLVPASLAPFALGASEGVAAAAVVAVAAGALLVTAARHARTPDAPASARALLFASLAVLPALLAVLCAAGR